MPVSHHMSATYSNDLLKVADHLAYRDGGRGRPQPDRLRRAVSTAYYALFHHLGYLTVEDMARDGALDESQRVAVRRWIDHGAVWSLCEDVRRPSSAVGKLFGAAPPSKLSDLAAAFVQLKGQRELADYSVVFDITKATALLSVDLARQAIEISDELVAADDRSFRLFLRLLQGGTKIAKTR